MHIPAVLFTNQMCSRCRRACIGCLRDNPSLEDIKAIRFLQIKRHWCPPNVLIYQFAPSIADEFWKKLALWHLELGFCLKGGTFLTMSAGDMQDSRCPRRASESLLQVQISSLDPRKALRQLLLRAENNRICNAIYLGKELFSKQLRGGNLDGAPGMRKVARSDWLCGVLWSRFLGWRISISSFLKRCLSLGGDASVGYHGGS